MSTDSTLRLFTAYLIPLLSSSSILPRLKELQRSLDSLDIQGLVDLLSQSSNRDLFINDMQPTSSDWELWKSERIRRIHGGDSKMEDSRFYTMSYLASASFKDCSIFISPRPSSYSNSSSGSASDSQPEQRVVREVGVYVIDLDLKPIARLRKWWELDRAIWECFGKTVSVWEEEGKGELRRCFI